MENMTEEQLYNMIDNGYIISYSSPKEIKKLKYIKYAIEKGQPSAINFLIKEENETIDELVYEAIDKGYKLNEYSKKELKQFKYIKYAIEKGQDRTINFIEIENLTKEEYNELEEIMYQQLKKGNDIIKFIQKKLINFKFNEQISKKIINNIELSFELLDYIKEEYLTEEIKEILNNKEEILKQYGKINTLEKNPVFSFEFVKYIYPVFEKEICIDLLKYNTEAPTQIIKQIKKGNIELIKKYYNKYSKLFNYKDKTIHYLFRNFDKIKPLIEDIINIELNEKEKNNLKNIILNNKFNITNLNELKNYETIINKKTIEMINSSNDIKDYVSTLFGYNTLEQLKKDFIGYDLDNFNKIKFIIKEINYNKDLLTQQEIKIILLMKEIIETNNIKELIKNIKLKDYSIDVRTIIEKIRKLYNAEIKSKLTDINSIKSKKTYHKKTITLYENNIGYKKEVNYEIIEMESEKFNFLAHRIYYFDQKMKEFCSLLLNNPSMWTKLDGANTISTSSISDKGFFMVKANDNNGVTYLFNKIPENFLLYMKGGDLFLEDGGHVLEPTGENNFTDINSLNQASVYRNCSFNEIAGIRENLIPCAIACVEEPNDDQIRAAYYFNIPIIKFNIKKYKKQNIENYLKSKEQLKINPTEENISNIFLSGDIKEFDDDLNIKYQYCLNILKEKYQKEELTQQQFIQRLQYIQSLLDRICDNNNPFRKLVKDIDTYIESEIPLINNKTL